VITQVNFDVLFFTRVPVKEIMHLIGRHFEEILRHFRYVLTTTPYFSFNGQFYGKIDGVVMGSPLSSVIANLYMQDFVKVALDSAHQNPFC
jgi:hypothetical protein